MARINVTFVILLAVLGVAGCGLVPALISPDSGVSGIVQAGPTCPVVQPGMNCADKPIVATVIVRFAGSGIEATRFTSDAQGMFRVALLPGQYVLDPQPAGFIGTPASQTVDVRAAQFTSVTIEYDTGIR